MIRGPLSLPRRLGGPAMLFAVLIFCFACQQSTFASEASRTASAHGVVAPALAMSAPAVVTGDFLGETMGNRTRMIQVACVFVAIGIFILTRSIK